MRIAALAVAFALIFAGCLSGGSPSGDAPSNASPPEEPVQATGPIEETLPESPGLESAPSWEPGDWWRVRMTERFTDAQATHESTRVVVGPDDGTGDHLVGMPADDWSDPMLLLHVPGFGRVAPGHLGFDIHDCPFQPLDFPLTDGKTWQTEFECRPVNATVTVESDTRATIQMVGPNDNLALTYDAEVQAITEIDVEGYGLVEIIDHGTGFQGNVTVPRGHDLVFRHGRIAAAADFQTQPAPPVETVTIDDAYDRVSFIFILGTVLPSTDGPPGVYREHATAPDDTTYEATVTPADEPGLHFFFHQHADPGGDWQLRHVAGGPGIAMIEGVGYETVHADLGG